MAGKPKTERDREAVRLFGLRVAAIRREVGLTQKQLSDKTKVSPEDEWGVIPPGVLGLIEQGRREIGISKVAVLADALGVDPGELFKPGVEVGDDEAG